MSRDTKFRARWRDTGELIPDFMDNYVVDAINDDVFIVDQYTPFLDKNGKDICVKDIVRKDGDFRVYVVSVAYDGRFYPHHEDSYSSISVIPTPSIDFFPIQMPEGICDKWEIIGNVYDNPELIKE